MSNPVICGIEFAVIQTGRPYTEYGQRIYYCNMFTGVYFYDVDRRIEGVVESSVPLSEHDVLRAYDTGNYRYPNRVEMSYRNKHEIECHAFDK